MSNLSLLVRRSIRATPDKLFEAWTRPEHLRNWWGPEGVACPEADVDLRVGGRYRLANLLPDGSTVWIAGRFERIVAPIELYTWRMEPGPEAQSRVTVRFVDRGDETEVIVLHEGIPTEEVRSEHESGWQDCLAGLELHVKGPRD